MKSKTPIDSKPRCAWAGDALLADYHDREWGRPIRTDAGHLERMALEIFQCGLSWRIVLVKRPALREAFEGFDVARVARYPMRSIDRLCRDAAIIRNRRKIEAVVHNAGVFERIAGEHGSYVKWFNRLAAASRQQRDDLFPLFRRTFRFMGPETTKCYLMGVGKIAPAHEPGCWRAG